MVPGIIAIVTIACLVGMVMYAFYAGCDPLKFGLIAKADQVCCVAVSFSLQRLFNLAENTNNDITVFEIFIWGGILLDMRLEI